MTKSKQANARAKAKKETVYEAAADIFAQYGFRRTSMNDIAQAAGVSRPALYLMFDNKESLFHELAAYRLEQAIEQAMAVLSGNSALKTRFIDAVLVFEKIYYEPVADSPHGAELMDINQSLATDVMLKGHEKLVTALAKELREAEKAGEVSFKDAPLSSAKAFVELLFSALGGIKKKASSGAEFRKQTEQLAKIFLSTLGI